MIRTLTGAAIAAALVVTSALAQQKTVRVVGTIVGVDGPTIVVKPRGKGDETRVTLTDKPSSALARCRRRTAARRRSA